MRDNAGGGHLNEGRMVKLQRWCLMEGERACQRVRGGQFNGGRIMLWRWPVTRRKNGCYRGGLFNEGRMVMLQRWSV